MKVAAYMSLSTEEQPGEDRYSPRAQLAGHQAPVHLKTLRHRGDLPGHRQ